MDKPSEMFEGEKSSLRKTYDKAVDKQEECIERIVIDYANLSGRETANRAEFRELVRGHLKDLRSKDRDTLIERVEKLPLWNKNSGSSVNLVEKEDVKQIILEVY